MTEASIDIERLARALRANFDLGHNHADLPDDAPCAWCLEDAAEVARDYEADTA